MSLIRWLDREAARSPFEQARELERIMSAFNPLVAAGRGLSHATVYPPLNIYDDGESFIVRAEVPGVNPKEIELNVTGDTLTLSGVREIESLPDGSSYHRRERRSGRFRRAFSLPEVVDSQKVTANCSDGVLEIRLPRAESAKPRTITIQA